MTILDKITAYKREEVAAAKARESRLALEQRAHSVSPTRGFYAALLEARGQNRSGLIAEVKKASPSKGLIRADFDPPVLARQYEQGGATCLSVLTDTPSFQGAPVYLRAAREATRLPVLRKDFMVDTYQVPEARAMGADAILVIMACTTDALAKDLIAAARDWKMDILVEVHNEEELDRALKLDAKMIGINNRDLKSFVTDLAVTERLAPKIPSDRLVVAESGLGSREDLARLRKIGVSSFLIGESLMRKADVLAATREILS